MRLTFVVLIALSLSNGAVAQETYRATFYGYTSPSAVQWLPFADGDSLGTIINQGHMVPSTEGFPPVAYSCTDTWYQHAGQQVGMYSGTCTQVDDDGDWYRYFFTSPPIVWEGIITCIDGTGKYEGIKCDATFRGISKYGGSGWFRGEIEGTMELK